MVDKIERYLKFAPHFKIILGSTNKTFFETRIDLPSTRNSLTSANHALCPVLYVSMISCAGFLFLSYNVCYCCTSGVVNDPWSTMK